MRCWLICAFVIFLFPASAFADSVRFLVAVGNDEGLSAEEPLRYAASDALGFGQVFAELGEIDQDKIYVLRNEDFSSLRKALQAVARRAKAYRPEDVQMVFYFSGHGSDEAIHMGGHSVPLAQIDSEMDGIAAGVHLMVIDACRGAGRKKGLVSDAPFTIRIESGPKASGRVIIRSSSQGESSQESDELRRAVFTHYLISGMRGAADTNRDGSVTLIEAYEHAYNSTLIRSSRSAVAPQHASLDLDLEVAGRFVLTRTKKASATLVLPAASSTAVYLVYDANTLQVMAEQRANPKENLPIALPKGDYVVHRRSSSSSGAMEISLPYGGRYDIADEDFHRIPAEALAQKGGAFLFRRHEFSAGYGLLLATPLSVGHALHLRYGYRLSRSMWISAGLRAGLRDYTTESSGVDVDGEERMVDGVVGTAVSFDVGPVELRASAAAVGRYLENQHTRLDLSPSSPYNSTWSGRMFAVGPEATFSVIMPINQALQWHVGLLANLLFAPAEPEVEMRSSSLAELGLGWTYD